MPDTKRILYDTLVELRGAIQPLQLHPTEDEWRAIMEKYDLMFVGKHFGTIYVRELCHSMNSRMGRAVTFEDLMSAVPSVCKELGMPYHGMILLSDAQLENPKIADYSIELL